MSRMALPGRFAIASSIALTRRVARVDVSAFGLTRPPPTVTICRDTTPASSWICPTRCSSRASSSTALPTALRP